MKECPPSAQGLPGIPQALLIAVQLRQYIAGDVTGSRAKANTSFCRSMATREKKRPRKPGPAACIKERFPS
eukprot:1151039-Pelagomonas_calceolata.AAC.1